MAIEIERKFLLNLDEWKKVKPEKSNEIKQAYLMATPEKTIRVRINDQKGYLTIKGASTGISRNEYEYEIPLADAMEMIDTLTADKIEKIRHYIVYQNKLWEVDEFKGRNKGLFVAEVELETEYEKISLPPWVNKEVSGDKKYSNSSLVTFPFSEWK